MREIKFRAWDGAAGYMFIQGKPDIETTSSFFFHKPDRAVLMQFTGLKDKNEKEIFEGDILLAHNYHRGEQVGRRQKWRVE